MEYEESRRHIKPFPKDTTASSKIKFLGSFFATESTSSYASFQPNNREKGFVPMLFPLPRNCVSAVEEGV